MIKNILVPFDGSAYASKAFKQALEITTKFNSNMTVLTVLTINQKIQPLTKKDIAKCSRKMMRILQYK